ncbi:hypothetical protein EVAR_41512_1 [Eumeta japonica]|uniref:Uncharacterized protein n=1 Tax=Eumeta variegata TaxID=151549 RepID=A0A4C1X3Y1_EUMVA|nr:hypothetical protein EVAR_41512_1 [Eumeta japonica]
MTTDYQSNDHHKRRSQKLWDDEERGLIDAVCPPPRPPARLLSAVINALPVPHFQSLKQNLHRITPVSVCLSVGHSQFVPYLLDQLR